MSDEKHLEEIWRRQLAFNRRFFADRGLDLSELSRADRIHWTKQFVLHVEGELHELLRETDWKMHRVAVNPVRRGNVLEEWVDCFKFLLGLANVWGFTEADVLEEFRRKSQVVEYRYGMEQRLRAISPHDRVVGVDIDGVLNDYPVDFCEWLVRSVPEFSYERRGDVPFLSTVKRELGPRRYLELKDAYRESGEKRTQRVREGAKELLDGTRAAGGTVVLLSKRPYWRFSRIYADTLEWLDRSGLRSDAVLFHPEKHRKIVDDFPGLVVMVEDDPAVAREVLAVGKDVILVEGELNKGVEVPGSRRVPGPAEALAEVSVLLKERNDGRAS
jgi:hypothetical protein